MSSFIIGCAICCGLLYAAYKTVQCLRAFFKKDDQTCRTVKKTKTYLNKWIIENFRDSKNLKSAVFSGKTIDGDLVKWNYVLEQNRYSPITVKVQCKTKETTCQDVEIKLDYGLFGVIKYSGTIGSALFQISSANDLQNCTMWTDSLTLRFQVTFIKHVLKDCTFENLPEAPPSRLAENYDALLQNEQFTDVTITVGQQQCFRAHKLILVARSTVFAAMFQHDMQESRCNKLTITDVEPQVFKEVLRFIYSDRVEGLHQMAHELLAAAEKYDLARLKALCEIDLITSITAKSATKTLAFADMYKADTLKARTQQFITNNLEDITDWQEFCHSNPDLAAEMFGVIAKGNKPPVQT